MDLSHDLMLWIAGYLSCFKPYLTLFIDLQSKKKSTFAKDQKVTKRTLYDYSNLSQHIIS